MQSSGATFRSGFEFGGDAGISIVRRRGAEPEVLPLGDGSCDVEASPGEDRGAGTVTVLFNIRSDEEDEDGLQTIRSTVAVELAPDDALTFASALAFAAGAILRRQGDA